MGWFRIKLDQLFLKKREVFERFPGSPHKNSLIGCYINTKLVHRENDKIQIKMSK